MKTSVKPNWDNYDEVIDWLFNQLPNYQAQGTSAYKPGLDTIRKLLKAIGDPQKQFKSIHIAGTNGKGSVAHILGAIYQNNEYKTGIFTSPHISDFRERIKINGKYVSRTWVLEFLKKNYITITDLKATFFEISTAMAFAYFANEKVDIAIIETGLGGRLDASNVLIPELSIITTVSKDHTQFLGEDLKTIATEKGGIIKNDIPVLIGHVNSEVEAVLKSIASSKNAEVYKTQEEVDYDSDLIAKYQKKNRAIALTAINILNEKYPVNHDQLKVALKNVMKLTNFKGRFQKLQAHPDFILDVAHNAEGVQTLFKEIDFSEYEQVHIVFGSSSDKDIDTIFKLFPTNANYYFTEFDSPRSLKQSEFVKLAGEKQLIYTIYSSPNEAVQQAKSQASTSGLILAFGSIYIMDSILNSHE